MFSDLSSAEKTEEKRELRSKQQMVLCRSGINWGLLHRHYKNGLLY